MLPIFGKIDGVLSWNWKTVFLFYWMSILLVAIYCITLFLIFVCLLCMRETQQSQGNIFCSVHNSSMIRVVGITWFLLFLGGNMIGLSGIIYGFSIYLEDTLQRSNFVVDVKYDVGYLRMDCFLGYRNDVLSSVFDGL